MKVRYEDVIKNEQIAIFIEKADMTIAQLGYTEHSFIYAGRVTQVAGMILEEIMFSKRDIELAKIAGYMHDIGNVINRTDHEQSGADRAPLVIIKGMAGTAKTFYSLAVGLEKEKIAPLMRPVIDNLEQILDSDSDERYENENELADKISEIFERGIIQTEAMNFIRGRSIAQTYLIIDEAQNMTPNQVKGIITRAVKNTKIILLGDPAQIDRPFFDEKTNGLSYAAKYMQGSPLCWQICLMCQGFL